MGSSASTVCGDSTAAAVPLATAVVPAAVVAAATATPVSFDWYASPLFYDIIFQEDTPLETAMLRQMARRFAAADSPMRRIRVAPPQPDEEEAEEAETEPAAPEASAEKTDAQQLLPPSASSSSPAASAVKPSVAPPAAAVIRVLEPACGSARLMLSLLEAGREDARFDDVDGSGGVQWSCVGFDLSEGAITFARERWAEMQQQQQQQQLLDQGLAAVSLSPSSTAASSVVISSSLTPPAPPSLAPPFTVFVADMCHFSDELAAHAPRPTVVAAAPAESVDIPAAPEASGVVGVGGFDLAHCLVSSLKHLLDPSDVAAHFTHMHGALASQGLYVVALHIHTLGGSSHFDRRVEYCSSGNNNSSSNSGSHGNASGAAKNAPTATGATTPAASALNAAPPASSAAAASSDSSNPKKAEVKEEETAAVETDEEEDAEEDEEEEEVEEIDDAFTRDYARGSTRFTADLITYAPDATSMTEKMIARVSSPPTAAAAPTSSAAASTAAAAVPSPAPLQSDMLLRVYTLSSLHSLLCSLSPLFELQATFSYADIYEEGWDASNDECQLTYPYPLPSVEQISSKQEPKTTQNGGDSTQKDAATVAPSSSSPSSSSSSSTLPLPPRRPLPVPMPAQQRNWNRVYPVPRHVREQWDGVEAVVLVLRRVD